MDTRFAGRAFVVFLMTAGRFFETNNGLLPWLHAGLFIFMFSSTESRLAAHWRVNVDGLIEAQHGYSVDHDPLLSILSHKPERPIWSDISKFPAHIELKRNSVFGNILPIEEHLECGKIFQDMYKGDGKMGKDLMDIAKLLDEEGPVIERLGPEHNRLRMRNNPVSMINLSHPLSCGRPVERTDHDSLTVIAQRDSLPVAEDNMLWHMYRKLAGRSFTFQDLQREFERMLAKEKDFSVSRVIELGNWWRIEGNTRQAVECFRLALASEPGNSDALLSFARLLFHLGYWEDTRQLLRHSLSVMPDARNSWMHHWTLSLIFIMTRRKDLARIELYNLLDYNPSFKPAQTLLRYVQPDEPPRASTGQYQIYTVAIALVLVATVVGVMKRAMQKEKTSKRGKPADCPCLKSSYGRTGVCDHHTCPCAASLSKRTPEPSSGKICRCCQAVRSALPLKHRRTPAL